MRFEIGNLQLFGLDLKAVLQRFKAGLHDILPAQLASAFVHPVPVVDAVVEQDNLRFVCGYPASELEIVSLQRKEMQLAADGALKADITRDVKAAQLQLNLVMPEAQVMRKRVFLPKVARHNLRNVVGFQVSRLTPFSVDKVFFDVVEIPSLTPSTDIVEVELLAVLKTDAQPWVDEIERLTGLVVARLKVVQAQSSIDLSGINLFPQQRTKNTWWLRLNRNSMLLAILVVLALSTAALPVLKLRTLVVERKHEIQEIDQRISGLQSKRAVLERDLTSLNHVLEQRTLAVQRSKILEELTRIVPDEIYINTLNVEKNNVVISGIGTGVVDLIELLNSSDLFEEAKFTSSITRSTLGQDIFTASLQVVNPMDVQ